MVRAADAPVLTTRQLNRALLARQMLLARAPVSIETAVERLVGLQAQNPFDPYLALWSRVEGFRPEDLGHQIEDRRVVRAVAMMRTTIHLLTAPDWLALRPVLQVVQRAFTTGSTFGRNLAGLDIGDVIAAGRTILDEEPMTGNALGKRLAERWPERDAGSLGYAVRYLLPLVQLPPRGVWGRRGQPVLSTAERWLGRSMGTDDDPTPMVRRYLAAFGPASVMDIQTWCWLTRLGPVVERLRPQLRSFRDEAGRELFDVPDGPLPDADTPAPPRFFPTFDNVFLSHKDRRRVLGEPAEWIGAAGQFDPVFSRGSFTVDGFVAGGWRIDRERDAATLVVLPVRAIAAADERAVADEGVEMLAIWAADAGDRDVRFERPA